MRRPRTSVEVVKRIHELRKQYPRWGRDKLAVLLRREGIEVSALTIGRVINRLKERGVLKEPVNVTLARQARKRRWKVLDY